MPTVLNLLQRLRLACCLLCLSCLPATAWADLQTILSAGEIEFEGGVLRDVRVAMETDGEKLAGSIQIARVQAAGSSDSLSDLKLTCASLKLYFTRLQCKRGSLQLGGKKIGVINELTIGKQGAGSHAELHLSQVQLAELVPILPMLGESLRDLSLAGTAEIHLNLNTSDAGTISGRLKLNTKGLAASNAQSTLAAEDMNAAVDLRFSKNGPRVDLKLQADMRAGYAYLMPVLQNYGDYPAKLTLHAVWDLARSDIHLRSLQWDQAGVATFHASGTLNTSPAVAVTELQLDIAELQFPGAYSQGLEPFLAGTPLDELDTLGSLSGQVQLRANRPVSLRLNLKNLHLDDRQRRFAIYGLDGLVHWSETTSLDLAEASTLAWDGMYLGRIPLGQARWEFRAADSNIRSERPLKVGLFDGALIIERFNASKLGSEASLLEFQASLEPVSLALLTSALGWPSFPGTLAGRLPLVTWQDKQLQFNGALKLAAFAGELTVDGLRMDDPLGLVPRAYADISLRQLDLTQLTSVFDFGRIDGRLNADIQGLELQKWLPVAFAARLYTPRDDRSRHRISQRAVNNISRVGGGGVGAALSSGFMQYFENFAYKKIGWSCTLAKGVCQMGGVDPAENKSDNKKGYTMVQGQGLPRIDVVGHAQQVSWTTLLQQLQAISSSRPATIK